jgi:3-oxoacyl-[acyl-carrier protein] reductase
MKLKDKVAIITGSGRGIGKDIAISLAKEGSHIVLVSRTKKEILAVKKEIEAVGVKALSLHMDLSVKKNIEILFDYVLKEFNSIDILINNAAVLFNTPFLELSEREWDTTLNINLKSVFLLSQKILKHMVENNKGYIINISSTAALTVPPGISAYGISKKALIGLSEAMYEIAKENGVKVTTIYPGMTDTSMLRNLNPDVPPEKWMIPSDITGCILFLLKQSDRVVIKDITAWSLKYDKI